MIYLAVLVLVLWIVMEWRPLGRKLYATGGNPGGGPLEQIAHRPAGVPLPHLLGHDRGAGRHRVRCRIGSASLTAGPPFLPAFAAVFLGSTQIRNGRAGMLGTLIAVYLLAGSGSCCWSGCRSG
ncbi:MAG: hypothetical protein R2736_05445 [Solirubrobacterales bacterium]